MGEGVGAPSARGSQPRRPKVAVVCSIDVDLRADLLFSLNRDFDLCAIGPFKHVAEKFAELGVRYRAYPYAAGLNPVRDLWSLLALAAMFRQERPALVHTIATKPNVIGRYAAWLARVPVILGTQPGLGVLYSSDDGRTQRVRRLYEQMQRLACAVSEMTTFEHEADRQRFVRSGIVRPERSSIVRGSGVRTDVFQREAIAPEAIERVRNELGLKRETVLVTMVSRVSRYKGVLEFAQAARALGADGQALCCLLVGPIDHNPLARLDVTELEGLKASVRWSGGRRDIPTVMAASQVIVLPTVYAEGIPRVLIEAASMGLPLVTTDIPGCRELVEHGVNGYLIPGQDAKALATAIGRLRDQPALREAFGRAARQKAVECFDLEIVANDFRRLYHQYLARRGLT
jgi:glycosyltransferase involved in cell wall biosynthesis